MFDCLVPPTGKGASYWRFVVCLLVPKGTGKYGGIIPNFEQKSTKNGQKTSNLAKKILVKFISNAPEEEKKWVRLASLDDIIRVIPAGTAEISLKKS